MFKILSQSASHPSYQSACVLLQDKGYQLEAFTESGNATTAVAISQAEPDLLLLNSSIILDEAQSLKKALKSEESLKEVPIIILADSPEDDAMGGKALEWGAHDFISYQANDEEVVARIQKTIRHRQASKQSKNLVDQLNKMNSELYERNSNVEKELYTTRQLQQSLLPPIINEDEEEGNTLEGKTLEHREQISFAKCHFKSDKLRITGVYLPCDALGGDIYDVVEFPDKTIGISIADVSGHGVPAAFVTAIFKSSFYRTTHNYHEPGDIMYHLNNELLNIVKTGQYVTGIYLNIDEDRKHMKYTGAGHPYPYYYHGESGSITRLEENGTPLIWFKDMEFPMGNIELSPGDKILIFSDGISELKNTRDELFGEERLGELFLEMCQKQTPHILDDVMKTLSDYTEGHPLDDDISAVVIEAL